MKQHSQGLQERLGDAVLCNHKAFPFNDHRTLSPIKKPQTPFK